MWINSSSSSNDSFHPNLSFADINLPLHFNCYLLSPSSFIAATFCITYVILLLPLSLFILYHGLQEDRKKLSTSSPATISHTDSFTYHVVAMEVIGVFGYIFLFCAVCKNDVNMVFVGGLGTTFIWYGESFYHILTCVERYLAVIHPIIYLNLRHDRGIRIRNISNGCVWLLSFVGMGLLNMETVTIVSNLCLVTLSLAIVSFCSLSVLLGLIRSGPQEQGIGRERVDQSKKRAFHTIVAILGVLVLRFTWGTIWCVLYIMGRQHDCVIMTWGIWVNLPASLVLPLLFLQRTVKKNI